ncbi:MAG TPA: flippase activity-associated protein Agl23 [Dehalococcoidia bacterium]|nr:flippase activity-associated protein Agl23 [Dehalococcoidia bacterium]
MAEATLGRRVFTLPASRVEAREWAIAHWDALVIAGLMVVAAVLRFYDLGDRALHHDESLHAQFTYYLYDGGAYKHDPLMHGPFQFHIGAAVYFLFGATDATARFAAAFFGTALVGMPYLLKKQIGVKAVIIAALFLCFSPTLLYYSRFARNEAWMAVWTLGIVICIWRYLDEGKNGWLYGLGALLALSFASKEVTFITAAIMLVFVDLMLAVELGKKREDEQTDSTTVLLRTAALVPIAWAIAGLWPLLGSKPLGRERLPPIGDVMVVLGTLTLPQFAAGIQEVPGFKDSGYFPLSTISGPTPEDGLRVSTTVVLLIVSAYVGLLWRPRVWLIAAAAFYVPYVLLYTTFFTNQPAPWTAAFWDGRGGFFSGIWGSLDYWLEQHGERRGNQPIYYYALLTPLYEFLPLLLALGGSVWMALRGDSFKRWLLFWTLAIFCGLSIAGEKMPWLEVHIALPLALAGAVALAKAIDALDFAPYWRQLAALAAVTAVAIVLIVSVDAAVAEYAGYVLMGFAGGAALVAAREQGRAGFARGALAVAVAALFTLTVRAGTMASFKHGDIPVEMMVYTQTSPDIPKLRDRIDALARESGYGRALPIVVDSSDGFSWPWAWYLREYTQVQYLDVRNNFKPAPDAVLLVARSNTAYVDSAGYSTTPYRHRWWFVEESYRKLGPGEDLGDLLKLGDNVWNALTSSRTLGDLWHYWLWRRPVSPRTVGSVDAVAYFPASLSTFDIGAGPQKPPPAPVTLEDGRIIIGASGSGQGEFLGAADVFVDAAGNIWVADSGNHRVQKFDRQGNFVAVLGGGGSGPGRLKEPWSVVVAPDGTVFVADTWNHRIQKFDANLNFVKAWGDPFFGANPGPFQMFGPRDIAIGPDGTLWVTDTGNKRIVNYTQDGNFIRQIGGPGSGLGQFDEQVGLAFDASGALYVADTWNERIQRFSPDLSSQTAYAAGWTSKDAIHKPYLAVLRDGRVVASEPAKGVLMLFDFRGPVRTWKPADAARPIGVAALPDGGFVFSDAANGQVQIVPGAALERLFR